MERAWRRCDLSPRGHVYQDVDPECSACRRHVLDDLARPRGCKCPTGIVRPTLASVPGGEAIYLRQRSRRTHGSSACLPGDYRSASRRTVWCSASSSAGRCLAAAVGSPSVSNMHFDGPRDATKPCSPLGNHRMLGVTDLTPSKTMVMKTRGATVIGHPSVALSPSDLPP